MWEAVLVSSPLARGMHADIIAGPATIGFIPAPAGSAQPGSRRVSRNEVYPRAGRVCLGQPTLTEVRWGSSPRRRGLLSVSVACYR